MTNAQDQRREPRFAVAALVPVIWGQNTPADCTVSDISSNGAFLEMDKPPALQVDVHLGPVGFQVRGRVVFLLPAAQAQTMGRAAGVGIQFDKQIDPDAFLLACAEAQAAVRAAAHIEAIALIALPGLGHDAIPLPAPPRAAAVPDQAIALPAPPRAAAVPDQAIALPAPPRAAVPDQAIALPAPPRAAAVPPRAAAVPDQAIALPAPPRAVPDQALPAPSPAAGYVPLAATAPAATTAPWATASAPAFTPSASAVTASAPAASIPLPSASIPLPGIRPVGAAPIALPAAAKRARARLAAEIALDPSAAVKPAALETFVAEVVIVEGVPGQTLLTQALARDDYTPLIAKHGLEGLALCLRRRPLLCIVGADAQRLSGRLLLEDIRRRPDLANVQVVLVDNSGAADPPNGLRWRGVPSELNRVRYLIDEAMGEGRGRATTKGPEAARDLAGIMVDLGRRLEGSGEHNCGIAALRYATELAPTVPEHTLALVRLLQTDTDTHAEAASLVERVVRQFPRLPEAHLVRALGLEQRGNIDEAAAALQRCLAVGPGNAEALAGLERLRGGGVPLPSAKNAKGAKPPPTPGWAEAEPEAAPPKPKGFFARLLSLFRR